MSDSWKKERRRNASHKGHKGRLLLAGLGPFHAVGNFNLAPMHLPVAEHIQNQDGLQSIHDRSEQLASQNVARKRATPQQPKPKCTQIQTVLACAVYTR